MARFAKFLRFFGNKITNVYWRILTCRVKKLPLKIVKGDFPQNVKYMQKNADGSKIIIVESLPGKRMIINGDHPVCLYFPYTYFVIVYRDSISPRGKSFVLQNFFIGFSSYKLVSTDGLLGRLPLSNYSSSYTFCLGDATPSFGPYKTVRQLAETYINSFWKSSFQMSFNYLDDWAVKTKINKVDTKKLIRLTEQISICDLIRVKKHEQFFEYQAEAEEAEAKRPSRNGSNRRKRKKSSRRKA